jgi:hypothetical protein
VAKEPEKYLSRIRTVSDSAVLSVPETAVIDTGDQKIVYVEREEGLYEGVLVELGPKSNGYYAVISGLLPGDQVAAAGAFLIDAETRLNPAASASYFGASGGPSTTSSESGIPLATSSSPNPSDTTPSESEDSAAVDFKTSRLNEDELAEIAKLSPEDQKLAKLQVLCPITMEPLGSMGKPLKVIVGDDAVMVCCKGCISGVKKNADKMLEQVRRWREKNQQDGSK